MKKLSFKLMMMLMGVLSLSIAFTACSDDDEILVKSIALDKSELSITLGETAQLTAVIFPENADNQTIVFSSSDDKVATVDMKGKITTVAMGIAIITATTQDGNKTATCKINVTASKANIIGKWAGEKTVVNGVENTDTDEKCATQRDYIEFLTDGTYKSIDFDENCQQKNNNEYEYTWTLNDNILTLAETYTFNSKKYVDETIYTVKKLNSTSMVLHVEKVLENGEEGIINWNGDDKDDDVTIYATKL